MDQELCGQAGVGQESKDAAGDLNEVSLQLARGRCEGPGEKQERPGGNSADGEKNAGEEKCAQKILVFRRWPARLPCPPDSPVRPTAEGRSKAPSWSFRAVSRRP